MMKATLVHNQTSDDGEMSEPLHVDDDTPAVEDGKVAVEFEIEKRSVKVLVPRVEGQPAVVE